MKEYHTRFWRVLAVVLSAVLVLGMTPVSALAATGEEMGGTITAFEALAEETASQTVALGTEEEALSLPDTLTATVRTAVVDSGETEESTLDSGEGAAEDEASPSETEVESTTGSAIGVETTDSETQRTVEVTWTASPAYDENTAGAYVYTPALPEGYMLADGVALPTITVTVAVRAAPRSSATTGSTYTYLGYNTATGSYDSKTTPTGVTVAEVGSTTTT